MAKIDFIPDTQTSTVGIESLENPVHIDFIPDQPSKRSIISQLGQGFANIGKGLINPPYRIVSHAIQGGQQLMGMPGTTFTNPITGDIVKPYTSSTKISEPIGLGLQGAAYGLTPMMGGTAFGAGQALEQGETPIKTVEAGLGGALLGKTAGMIAGEPLFTGKLGELAKERLAPSLQKGAEASYRKVLGKVTKEEEKRLADRIAPELVNRKPFIWTREGLKNVAERKSEIYGNQINDEWAKLSPDIKVSISPLIDSIDKEQKALEINDVIIKQNEAEHESLQRMKMDLINIAEEPNNISPQTIRKYRQQLDDFSKARKKGFSVSDADNAFLSANKTMANSVRNEIAKQYPDINKLNKEFNFYDDMNTLLESTIKKQKSIWPAFHSFVAAHPGERAYWGLYLKNLGSLFSDNVAWNSLAGSTKARLANLTLKGDINRANLTVIGLLKQLGKKFSQ